MKATRLLAMISLIAVMAMAFAGIGMAYTASTENTSNTVSAEYVVLYQHNYEFTSSNLRFDVVTNEMGTTYQIRKAVPLLDLDGELYYGVQIGATDQLRSYSTMTWNNKVNVSTLVTEDNWFTDYSDEALSWRYILKIEATFVDDAAKTAFITANPTAPLLMYAIYDGSGDEGDVVEWDIWKPTYDQSGNITGYESTDTLTIIDDVVYETKLYFSAVGVVVEDGSVFKPAGKIYKATENISMVPVWIASTSDDDIKITLESGKAGSPETHVMYMTPGANFVLPGNQYVNGNAQDGYKLFVGWYEKTLNKTYPAGYVFMGQESDMNFVAQWVDAANTSAYRTVVFDSNLGGGYTDCTMENRYVSIGDTFSLPLCEYLHLSETYNAEWNETTLLSKINKKFVGWSENASATRNDGVSKIYTEGENMTLSLGTTTLYAIWEDLGTSKIVRLTGLVTEIVNHEVVRHDKTYTLYTDEDGNQLMLSNLFEPKNKPTAHSDGWKFMGWYVKKISDTRTGKVVAMSLTMPNGYDNQIINNGLIQFTYNSDPAGHNREITPEP